MQEICIITKSGNATENACASNSTDSDAMKGLKQMCMSNEYK